MGDAMAMDAWWQKRRWQRPQRRGGAAVASLLLLLLLLSWGLTGGPRLGVEVEPLGDLEGLEARRLAAGGDVLEDGLLQLLVGDEGR